jgi:hypothetical protein
MGLLVEILENLVSQTLLITAAKGEEPDLASLVSQEISAMDQAIEEVRRSGFCTAAWYPFTSPFSDGGRIRRVEKFFQKLIREKI